MSLYSLLATWLPEPATRFLRPIYFSTTPLFGAPLSIVRHEGALRGSGEHGRIDVASRSRWLGPYMADRMFSSVSSTTELGSCRIYDVARRLRNSDADLGFALTGRYIAPKAFGDGFLLMPSWVGHRAAVPRDLESRRRILARVDGDTHLIKRNGLRYELDRDPLSVPAYHRDFYVPTIVARYGPEAPMYSTGQLLREIGHGAILWVLSGDTRVAGIFLLPAPPVMGVRAIGLAGGDYALAKLGALSACYVFLFQVANEFDCEVIDYRGTRPSQSDGVFRYKQKWRSELYESEVVASEDIAVHWPRPSAAVDTFLRGYAPVFRCTGGLAAVDTGVHRIPEGVSTIAPAENPGDTAAFLAATTARKPPE